MREGLQSPRLLEREGQLDAIDAAIGAADEGSGRAILFEGVAGIGKTSLLAAAASRGALKSVRVLVARGEQLERHFPWGVAIQLFAGAVASPDSPELLRGAAGLTAPLFERGASRGPGAPDPFPLVHGLHWLTANLAERAPLVLLVDDAHWSDPESLGFLHYLLPRLEELPASLVMTARIGDPTGGDIEDLLAHVRAHPASVAERVEPLDPDSIRSLVRSGIPESDDAFCDEVARAVAGNPFLCRELIAAVRAEDIEPTWVGAARLQQLRPETVRNTIAVRLGRLGSAAGKLAAATAVLGARATVPRAAKLAALDDASAAEAADALAGADILEIGPSLSFVHPIIADIVHADLAPGRLRRDHLMAARILLEDDVPPEEVAAHVLRGGPAGEEWAAAVLREAAGIMLTRGAPTQAAELLSRALEEPGGRADPGLLLQLGRTETALGSPTAVRRLEAAVARARDPLERATALDALGFAQYFAGETAAAVVTIREALGEIEPGRGGVLEAELLFSLFSGRFMPELVEETIKALDQPRTGERGEPTPAEIVRRAGLGFDTVLRVGAAPAEAHALWAFRHGMEARGGLPLPFANALIGLVLAFVGRYEEAGEVAERALESAHSRGNRLDAAMAYEQRVLLRWRVGDVGGVLADTESILELSEGRWDQASIPSRVARAIALLERAEDAEAVGVLDLPEALERRLPGTPAWLWLPYGRAHIAFAAGDWAGAAKQALTARTRLAGIGAPSPDYMAWRSLAARALYRSGDRERALVLAEEELALARANGARRTIGNASATVGVLRGGEAGIEALQVAVDLLDHDGARLDAGTTRLDLGIALRHARRPKQARRVLAEALDSAHGLGSVRLAEAARIELSAAGGRPRRIALTGVESLTPAQRRVTELGAGGMSNREIAEALFLTVRTVETHLTAAYAKLGISSREELPRALRGHQSD
jgi:DNA-binding CsgD family transcriptional regulator/tetratricopeptide (TPR) repeat protein